jgi:uncharacterized protein (UPF0335 family)
MVKVNTEGYVYVMISTLNQMVNYIPLKHYKFDDIINITVQEADYVNNDKWDENLENILKKEGLPFNREDKQHIRIAQNEVNDIENTLDLLDTLQDKPKIFWNITGGQRPFILAIQQFIQEHKRTEDYVCYLEGNQSKMVILQNNEKIDNESYNLDYLKIFTALELMGFDIKVTETSHRNLIEKYDEVKEEREFYLKFLEEYIKIKDSNIREKLLKNLIHLNKNYPSENPNDTFTSRVKKFEEERKTAKTTIKEILKNLDSTQLEKELEQGKSEGDKKVKSFGFILEKLAGYKILEHANGKIADISFGEKINHLREEDRVDKKPTDEFDIALLTKNGKFMIFECKSGGMEGDVAKSTKYSTYAVSGVYGKPILITPLLEEEIIAIRKKSHLENGKFKYLKDALYTTIRQAINSAIRAGLEVWGIDEIATKIEKYIG